MGYRKGTYEYADTPMEARPKDGDEQPQIKPETLLESLYRQAHENTDVGKRHYQAADILRRHPEFEEFLTLLDFLRPSQPGAPLRP